ncbi:MAG: hypothetical protein MUQ00_02910 [Candidatus Aminicenantes bacterium]|nr:hypothetical protein [Candidatus Aminicenantes bacterium]
MFKAGIRRVEEKEKPIHQLPENIKQFIERTPWTFAKTYAKTWPHEYIVQEKVDNELFLQLANLIDTFGYVSNFYKTTVTYYDYNGHTYWHMENIINRCDERDTFHRREKDGRLPTF